MAFAYPLYGAVVALISISFVFLYRLYLHPLANIPGPKIVAVSRFYEWYCDCIQPAVYYRKIKDWHKIYGPIVRIGPNEVHIDDAEYFDVLYSNSVKLDKDAWYYRFAGTQESTFATVEHDLHRLKRSKQNPFFSRQNVDKSAPILARILGDLFAQFETFRGNGKPLPLRPALRSFTLDAVCGYSFPSGMEAVKSPNFGAPFHSGQEAFVRLFPWFRHFPIIAAVVMATPDWVAPYLDKGVQAAMSFPKFIEAQVTESIRQSTQQETVSRKTIIRELYESDMPAELRTKEALEAEATAIVGAASTTTSHVLELGIFHILSNPSILKALTEELRAHKPQSTRDDELLTHRDLEPLPYLGAIFLETQRMVPGTFSRLPRRIPQTQEPVVYQSYRLPPGTVVGMSNADVLHSEKVWGDAVHTFDPSRWLDPSSTPQVSLSTAYKTKMGKYVPAFSRGSRNCIGQNLATAEFYVMIGNLFRRFDVQLFETGEKEIEIVQDCFGPLPYKGSVGVRLLLS